MGNTTTYRYVEDKAETARWNAAVGVFVISFGGIEATAVEVVERLNPQSGRHAGLMRLGPRIDRAVAGLELHPTWRRERVRQALEVAKRMIPQRNLIAHSPMLFRFQLTATGASMGLVLGSEAGGEVLTLEGLELLAKRANRVSVALGERWEAVVYDELCG